MLESKKWFGRKALNDITSKLRNDKSNACMKRPLCFRHFFSLFVLKHVNQFNLN